MLILFSFLFAFLVLVVIKLCVVGFYLLCCICKRNVQLLSKMFCELFVNQMLCGLYLAACKNNIKKGHLLKHSRTFLYLHTLIYCNTFIAVYECLFICVYIFANLCVQLSMFFFHIFFVSFINILLLKSKINRFFFIIFIKIRKNNLSIKVCQFKKKGLCVLVYFQALILLYM